MTQTTSPTKQSLDRFEYMKTITTYTLHCSIKHSGLDIWPEQPLKVKRGSSLWIQPSAFTADPPFQQPVSECQLWQWSLLPYLHYTFIIQTPLSALECCSLRARKLTFQQHSGHSKPVAISCSQCYMKSPKQQTQFSTWQFQL